MKNLMILVIAFIGLGQQARAENEIPSMECKLRFTGGFAEAPKTEEYIYNTKDAIGQIIGNSLFINAGGYFVKSKLIWPFNVHVHADLDTRKIRILGANQFQPTYFNVDQKFSFGQRIFVKAPREDFVPEVLEIECVVHSAS